MTFKMKGPGLPGFRKQQGSGFYKSNPIPRTDHRSPIKQGSDDARQAEIEKARKEYIDYIEAGGDPNKVDWQDKVMQVNKDITDGVTTTTTEESQWGEIPAGRETIGGPKMSNEDWKKFVEENPDWNTKKVFRGDVNVETKSVDPEVEWTNHKLNYNQIGKATHKVKHDMNDGTFRYNIEQMNGVNLGELSANDIDQMVKAGKLKHNNLGQLMMSKDFYENTYLKIQQIREDQNQNYENWQKQGDDFRSNVRKEAHELGLEAGKKGSKAYQNASATHIKNMKEQNPKMYPKSGVPNWMMDDVNYYGHNLMANMLSNDDETLINLQHLEKGEDGRWALNDEGKEIMDNFKNLSEEEQAGYLKGMQDNSKNNPRGARGRVEDVLGATPSHLADAGDFYKPGDESIDIQVNE